MPEIKPGFWRAENGHKVLITAKNENAAPYCYWIGWIILGNKPREQESGSWYKEGDNDDGGFTLVEPWKEKISLDAMTTSTYPGELKFVYMSNDDLVSSLHRFTGKNVRLTIEELKT